MYIFGVKLVPEVLQILSVAYFGCRGATHSAIMSCCFSISEHIQRLIISELLPQWWVRSSSSPVSRAAIAVMPNSEGTVRSKVQLGLAQCHRCVWNELIEQGKLTCQSCVAVRNGRDHPNMGQILKKDADT